MDMVWEWDMAPGWATAADTAADTAAAATAQGMEDTGVPEATAATAATEINTAPTSRLTRPKPP